MFVGTLQIQMHLWNSGIGASRMQCQDRACRRAPINHHRSIFDSLSKSGKSHVAACRIAPIPLIFVHRKKKPLLIIINTTYMNFSLSFKAKSQTS
jgi:hypothetical protein